MFTPEPYQIEAADWLACHRMGLVECAAGGGKTHIMAMALDKVIRNRERKEKVRIGAMCNTTDQADQIETAFNRFESIKAQDVIIRCAGADTDWLDRDVLLVDEVHHAGTAPSWQRQIESCQRARWGFSATLGCDGNKAATNRLLQMFGGNIHRVNRSEVAENRLVPARVILLDAFDDGLGPQIDEMIEARMKRDRRFSRLPEFKLLQRVSWDVIRKHGIEKNHARNAAAIELAKHHAENHVLILVNTIKHGMDLQKQIPGSRFCSASGGKALRHKLIDEFKAGKLHCLIATSLADEGLDCPICDVLLLASGGQSETKAIQRTGRALRAYPGKTHALIYEFLDSSCRLMAKHSEKRREVFKKLGYEIEGKIQLDLI